MYKVLARDCQFIHHSKETHRLSPGITVGDNAIFDMTACSAKSELGPAKNKKEIAKIHMPDDVKGAPSILVAGRGQVTLRNECDIAFNVTGPAIQAGGGSMVNIEHSKFQNCRVGILATGNAKVTTKEAKIVATVHAGVEIRDSAFVHVANSSIRTGRRGALLMLNMGRALVEDSLFARHNMATVGLLSGVSFKVRNSKIEDSFGSGILVHADFQGKLDLDKVTVSDNRRYGIESMRKQDLWLKNHPGVEILRNGKGNMPI